MVFDAVPGRKILLATGLFQLVFVVEVWNVSAIGR
jgi:hypothetical protein